MKHRAFSLGIICVCISYIASATTDEELQQKIAQLQKQTIQLQTEVTQLQNKLSNSKVQDLKQSAAPNVHKKADLPLEPPPKSDDQLHFHNSVVNVHSLDLDPESAEFYPTALVTDDRVLTYIAGTPVVTSPYLGSRPAFDGSDYMVNISSINRDIRLMQQRRGLERAYRKIGYPIPNKPILAFSGKAQPIGVIGQPFFGESKGDWDLGASELDLAALLNSNVEAYMGIAYSAAPPSVGGQRVANSNIFLNMGFVNIGDLDVSPFYLTAGQLYAPFGRYSTAMVSPTLPMLLTRIKSRPVILGYKSQKDTGPFISGFGYRGDTTYGSSGVGGLNIGYIFDGYNITGEVGGSYISSLNDATGMQYTSSVPFTTFGGFASLTNGSENVAKVPGMGAHFSVSFDRYNLTAEWVSSVGAFREEDLSFNGHGAQPQALQLEGGLTFMSFDRPSSVAASYQWSQESLALNLPNQRLTGVFNISIWKDTIESLEYRHDFDFKRGDFGNGAAPVGVVNATTYGTGGSSNMLAAQIGVFF